MANNGWIKLHRSFLEWEWFSDANMVKCFVWLLLNANTTSGRWCGITVGRGQVIVTLRTMAQEVRLTVRAIRTIMSRLESTGEITKSATHGFTVVTICNYDSYQASETGQRHTTDTPNDTRPTHQTTHQTTQTNDCVSVSNEDVRHTKRHIGVSENDTPNDTIIRSIKNKENIVVDARACARKEILNDLSSHRGLLEQFCMANYITYDQCLTYAKEILSEWEFTGQDITDRCDARKHLLATIRIKASEARKQAAMTVRRKPTLNDDDNKYVNDEWKN